MIGSSFPFYPRPRTSFIFDIKSIEIITICAVTACTFIIILPGIRGKVRIFWLLKVLISLFIGSVILAVNFTNDWEVGSVTAITAYKSFSSVMVNASIGLLIGLKGINITLTGNPVYQLNETINYNEEFDWGSGNKFAKDYQQSLETGLPNPVLYVAEKFLIDSPCGHHQQYCISAYYTSAIMWVAFCSWIICNVLFCMPVLLYGIFMMFATSFCILLSLLLFAIVRQTPLCKIQFGNSTLTTTFGLSFWLSFATAGQQLKFNCSQSTYSGELKKLSGIICLLISLMLLIIHCRRPQTLRYFFNYDKTGNIPKRPNKEVYTMDNNESIKLHKMF